MLIVPGTFDKTTGCTPLPADSPFAKTTNRPLHMTDGDNQCLVACNKTEVEATGVDPCHVGSLTGPTLSNSQMSCFDLGPGTAGGGGGACGYNCSLIQTGGAPCTDRATQQCGLLCDTRA